jgi:hypothetical protein
VRSDCPVAGAVRRLPEAREGGAGVRAVSSSSGATVVSGGSGPVRIRSVCPVPGAPDVSGGSGVAGGGMVRSVRPVPELRWLGRGLRRPCSGGSGLCPAVRRFPAATGGRMRSAWPGFGAPEVYHARERSVEAFFWEGPCKHTTGVRPVPAGWHPWEGRSA